MIYADNAATTRLDEEAFDSMRKYMVEEFGNPSQPYSFSRSTRKALLESREIIASCIGADSDEIFFTSGGTESDNWALKGYMNKQKDKSLLVSSIEHHAVLNTASALKRVGTEVRYLKVNEEGTVLPSFLESEIDNNVALVSVMLANNEIGSIQPLNELSKITHNIGARIHTDAVQAVGHINVNVNDLDVDMLSASAHKFNGPRGIGFLYIRKGTDLYPLIDGGGQEKKLRSGTENVASIVAMAIALKKNNDEISRNKEKLTCIENELISRLKIKGLNFIRNGSPNRIPGNVNLSFKDADGEMLLHRLDLMGICISTGSACDSKNSQISHVIEAIGVPPEYAYGTIRISFGRDNTINDAITIANAIEKVVAEKI